MLLFAVVLVAAVPSNAQTAAKKGTGTPSPQQAVGGGPGQRKYVTVVGEIVDMGCYTSQGLVGAIHRECALKCLAMGVPMGIITTDSVLYTLTENHDRAMTPQNFPPPDPFLQCRAWPSFRVEVSGWVWERKGARFLEVRAAKLAPAPVPPAAP